MTLSNYDNEVYAEENTGSSTEVAPSAISMDVSGDKNGVVETGVGVTAYRTHDVTVNVSDVQEYYLKISGSSQLNPPTGGEAVPSVTEATTGAEMPEDSWGYAWDWSNTEVDKAEMTYVGMPAIATSLEKPTLVNGNASFTGKLSFAAKFKQNAVLGNYGSGVTLTLIATPKSNTGSNHGFWYNENGAPTGLDSGTASMQDADPNFCRGNSQVGVGWTVELEDNRDGKTYTIVKLKDGNCWMQENLALEADPEKYPEDKYPDGMPLAPADTDLPADTTWNLPRSTTEWDTSTSGDNNGSTKAQVATGNTGMSGWKQGYGNYYSWIAATAGTGNDVTSDGGTAAGSICPRGWTLPTGSNSSNATAYNQFRNLFGTDGTGLGSSAQIRFDTVQKAPYSFGAAGNYGGSLSYAGTRGYYWSRTSNSSTGAYDLGFSSGYFYPGTSSSARYRGYSVRCVQDAYGTWQNNTGTGGKLNTGLKRMQDINKANFTQAYCAKDKNDVVSVGSTINLVDTRDGRNYTVVKLADGNCWMQENLALSGSITLTNNDSDITAASWTLPADASSWGTNTTSNANTVQVKTGSTSLNGWKQGWGNYYSWQAATAGTGSSATTDGANASSSICPKGWKLPTGKKVGNNTVNQFETLFGVNGQSLNGTTTTTAADYQKRFELVQAAPYKFPAAGSYSGSLYSAGTYGRYWSRTSRSSTYAYNLYFSSGDFYPGTNNFDRYVGFSVRCVAEPEN